MGFIPILGKALATVGAAVGTALASPVVLAAAVVSTVVVAGVVVYKNRDGISSFFSHAWNKGKALVGAVATAVAGAVDNSIKDIKALFAKAALATTTAIAATATAVKETLDPIYTVYKLADEAGTAHYVGRTKNETARKIAHRNDPNRAHLEFVPIASGLNRFQARGYEQIMMLECHTINTANRMNNQINGISPHNKKLDIYMEAGRGVAEYVGNQISNEILNWTGK